jgi:voltage-gated potassium channel
MCCSAVGHTIRGNVIAYTVCGAVVLIYAGSLAILQAERGQPGAKIMSLWSPSH